jgi:hypothetical protein
MDAQGTGIGYVVPMPRFLHSHIGDVAYIDEDGVVRATGNVFEDAYFKELLACSQSALDRTDITQEYAAHTYAFTTGCVEVKPMTDDECSR